MSTYAEPLFAGSLGAMVQGDIEDFYVSYSDDLEGDETLSSVAFSVTGPSGAVTGMVGDHTETDSRTDFRVTAPTASGVYTIALIATISDGQKITRFVELTVV